MYAHIWSRAALEQFMIYGMQNMHNNCYCCRHWISTHDIAHFALAVLRWLLSTPSKRRKYGAKSTVAAATAKLCIGWLSSNTATGTTRHDSDTIAITTTATTTTTLPLPPTIYGADIKLSTHLNGDEGKVLPQRRSLLRTPRNTLNTQLANLKSRG